MIWIGTALGVIARSPDTVQGAAFMVIFPLTFVASAFVPIRGLPTALRSVAKYDPISAVAAAARTLFGNPVATPHAAPWSLRHPALAAVLWCVVLLAAAVPATLWAFRRRTVG